MKVLVVIAHPAHVHFFRPYIEEMEKREHEVSLMVKERENTTKLLDLYGFDYEEFGQTYLGRPAKGCGVILNDMALLRRAKDIAPDISISIGGLYSSHVGSFLGIPTIDFMDTVNAYYTNMLTFPFATVIATPDCYTGRVPDRKHLSYKGYHELAYLHPDRFTPDRSKLKDINADAGEYTIVRYSTLDASHQREEGVLTRRKKIDIVRELAEYGPVFVDTEGELPTELEEHRLSIPDHHYHHVLAFAKLYVGEGATTASEAGVLGVPWIYLSNRSRCYLHEQEIRYDLGATVSSESEALEVAEVILEDESEVDFELARKSLLKDKIDVTKWMISLSHKFL